MLILKGSIEKFDGSTSESTGSIQLENLGIEFTSVYVLKEPFLLL